MGRCKNFPDNCKKLPDKCKYFPDSCKNFPDKSKNFPDFLVVKRSLTIKNRKFKNLRMSHTADGLFSGPQENHHGKFGSK